MSSFGRQRVVFMAKSKYSNTHEVEEQRSSECPLASMWRPTWCRVPLFSLDTCCHQQLLEKEMIFPSSVSKVLLESPATSALKYSLHSVLPGAAKSIEEEGTASPPVMGAQSFPLPGAIMYSSVWDYRSQRENTITQKWTWKAKLFNHFFSLWTCHDLHSRYFRFLKHRTKETRGMVVVETCSSFS